MERAVCGLEKVGRRSRTPPLLSLWCAVGFCWCCGRCWRCAGTSCGTREGLEVQGTVASPPFLCPPPLIKFIGPRSTSCIHKVHNVAYNQSFWMLTRCVQQNTLSDFQIFSYVVNFIDILRHPARAARPGINITRVFLSRRGDTRSSNARKKHQSSPRPFTSPFDHRFRHAPPSRLRNCLHIVYNIFLFIICLFNIMFIVFVCFFVF